MGERLTTRLRDLAFTNILRQDIAFFDKEENSTGAITARLATEVTLIKVFFSHIILVAVVLAYKSNLLIVV